MSLSISKSRDSSSESSQTLLNQPPGQSKEDNLFPLLLTPFELFLVLDERRDCPITSFIELHFSRSLQRGVLEKALHRTVHRHPLLASRLVEIDGKLHWDYAPEFVPQLLNPEDYSILQSVPGDLSANKRAIPRRIDLFHEPGCRYWYEERETGKSRLTIQLHHAVCDGVGMRAVLIDVLSAYAKTTTVDFPNESKHDSRKLAKRHRREGPLIANLANRADFSAVSAKPASIKISAWQKLKKAYYFHFQHPQPLVAAGFSENAGRLQDPGIGGTKGSNNGHDQVAGQHHQGDRLKLEATLSLNEPLRHHIFPESISSRLLEYCRKHEISLNDLALTILFRACSHWNRITGINQPGTRIRLLMPFDLRGRADLRMPATNRLSFSFLGRKHQECEDWTRLLASVQKETQWIKASRVSMDFLNGLTTLARYPKWLKRILQLKSSRNMSTSVLTYTGDIARGMKSYFPEEDGRRRIGDTHLENILIAPPTRENTNLTMGVCINWGQICISANWNRNAWSDQDCEAFLGIYADAMLEWLETMTRET